MVDGELCERVGALALEARQEFLRQAITAVDVGKSPVFAIDLGCPRLVAANAAGRAFWGISGFRLADDGIRLDAAMPALRDLHMVGGSAGAANGAAAIRGRIVKLTFWTPSGSRCDYWNVATVAAPEHGRAVVLSITQAPATPVDDDINPVASAAAEPSPEDPVMLEIARMVAAAGEGREFASSSDGTDASAKPFSVAVLSHELRTPLTSVIGFAEVMKSGLFGPLDNARYQDYVGIIVDSARHALALVEAAAAAIAPPAATSGDTVADLLQLARSSVAAMALSAERSGITLIGPADAASVLADVSPTSLRQILFNLVSNALNATPAGGCVDVSVGIAGDRRAVVAVADSGPGLPAGVLEQLRSEPAAISGQPIGAGPHGLGLGVIRQLAFAHGGELSVVRSGPDGTTIEVRFRQPAAG